MFIVQQDIELSAGSQLVSVELASVPLAAGEYSVWVADRRHLGS